MLKLLCILSTHSLTFAVKSVTNPDYQKQKEKENNKKKVKHSNNKNNESWRNEGIIP